LIKQLTAKIPLRNAFIIFFLTTGLLGLKDFLINFSLSKLISLLALYVAVYVIGHQLLLHRYFTHKQFKVSNTIHNLFCFWSVLACMGSPLTYRFDHRLHHKFSDTEKDIHGPKIGLFRCFYGYQTEKLFKLNESAINDSTLIFVHKNYYLILLMIVAGLFFTSPLTLCYFSLAVAFNIFVSDIFNYLNHSKYTGSYRNYDLPDNSSNHPIWGYFAFCWHNNHHRYPSRANEQTKWWELDLLYLGVIKWVQK